MPFIVDDEQRAQLLWLVARFLDAMHCEGIAYGDISWDNFSFQFDPKVRLSVYYFESTRAIGSRAMIIVPTVNPANWHDPEAPGEPASFDTDRYKFALLAYRMLVSKTLDARIDSAQIPKHLATFNDRQVRHMRRLWIRAAGERGTRPTIHEWLWALEG